MRGAKSVARARWGLRRVCQPVSRAKNLSCSVFTFRDGAALKKVDICQVGLQKFLLFMKDLNELTKDPKLSSDIVLSAVARLILSTYSEETRIVIYNTLDENAEHQRTHALMMNKDKLNSVCEKPS